MLSRSPQCSGVVAVFGEAHQRAVLGDIETFVSNSIGSIRIASNRTELPLTQKIRVCPAARVIVSPTIWPSPVS
jgi:hypothetical protein